MATTGSINRRVLKLIELLCNKNQKDFADQIGIAPTTISSIVTTKNSEPKYSVLNRICVRYPEVNARWLLTGKGSPLIKDETN